MKVTLKNINNLDISTNERILLSSLLIDLNDLNQLLEDKGQGYRKLFIDWQEYHNEYSPERTDPCPDYYGYYRLYSEKDPYNNIGSEMTIDDLDNALLILIEFIETELS